MLVENTREKAMRAFLSGKKVRVLTEYDDGSLEVQKFEDLFPEGDTHYLVDAPAYANPEFEQEVQRQHDLPDQNITAREQKSEPEEARIAPPLEQPVAKSKKEVVQELKAKGMTVKEISEQTGIKTGTVYCYYNSKVEATSGRNADRHLCKECKYRGKKSGCEYALIAGHSRGCAVEECDKYEKGEQRK